MRQIQEAAKELDPNDQTEIRNTLNELQSPLGDAFFGDTDFQETVVFLSEDVKQEFVEAVIESGLIEVTTTEDTQEQAL